MGVKSLRPTWFEDETVAKTAAEPMHGLRLIIKEDVLPLSDHPKFEALAEVAKRGLLAPETWHCNRPYINLKTTIDVPLLGTVIEQNGDGCLEDSLMPVGWPLHLDGAVKQRCLHRTTTLSELDELLQAYDMKRNLVELNYEAAQWKHKAVWTRKYMEAKRGHGLIQLWNDHEIDITRKRPTPVRSRQMISSEQRVLQPENPRPVCPTVSSFEHLARKRSILHLLRQVHCHLGQQKNGRDVFAKTKPSPSYTKPKKADKSSLKKMVEKCWCQSSWTDRLMKPRH
jgi:hypothetical protein